MTIDTIEELRAELRECVFTPAERKALERELAELIRRRNEALAAEGGGISPLVLRFTMQRR
jgi:hypothetical protein